MGNSLLGGNASKMRGIEYKITYLNTSLYWTTAGVSNLQAECVKRWSRPPPV